MPTRASTDRWTPRFTEDDATYLAGLIDGEAHLSAARPKTRNASVSPLGIVIVSTDLAITHWLRETFGGRLNSGAADAEGYPGCAVGALPAGRPTGGIASGCAPRRRKA